MPFKRVFYRLLGGDLGVPRGVPGALREDRSGSPFNPYPVINDGREFALLMVPGSPVEKIGGALAPEAEGGWDAGR
jgi:hypothetical protein